MTHWVGRLRVGLLGLLALGSMAGPLAAQNAVVRGTVTSAARQEALGGVSIIIPALGLSAVTDEKGQYSLTIPAARISSAPIAVTARGIGYRAMTKTQVIPAGETVLDFVLETDISRLEEIVVTGVTEATERAKVAFSVGRITAEDVPVPSVDPVRTLSGRVAGVRISASSGQPGETPEIVMRGPTSINASGRSQGPLIIVDGVIMNVGNLNEIAATDIESIEVVKGAAGSTLYGARASQGVISIRTKRGGADDGVRFNLRSEVGFNDIEGDFGSAQFHRYTMDETGTRFCVQITGLAPCSRTIDWMSEIMRVNNPPGDNSINPVSLVGGSPAGNDLRNRYQTSRWPGRRYNPVAQTVTRQPFLLMAADMTGRVGSTAFFVSGSRQEQQGALRGLDGTTNTRGRINLDFSPRSDLKIAVSSMYDDTYLDNVGPSFFRLTRVPAGTDILATDTLGRRLVRVDVGPSGQQNENPLQSFENLVADLKSNRILGSINASYFPATWVTLDGTFAYDTRSRVQKALTPKGYRTTTPQPAPSTNGGSITQSNLKSESFNTALTGTFRKQLTSTLNGKLQLGGAYDQFDSEGDSHGGNSLRVVDVYSTTNAGANYFTSSSRTTTKRTSVFASGTLDYKDRYIVDGQFRYDGSSLFGADERWAPFYRTSVVWRASQEPFWFGGRTLSELRFRASRGTAGGSPPFGAKDETYILTASGVTLGQAGNSLLKPETTTETEVGTEFELFRRIGVELTYAYGITKDQIFPVNTAAALGFTTQWQNAGTLENKTWELAVNIPILNNRNFYWQTRLTWDRNRTLIKELFVPEFIYTGGTAQGTSTFFTIRQGDRYGNIWGRKFLKSCTDLPETHRNDCGDGKSFQVNDDGWLVWVGAGNSWRDGITKNLWQTQLPASQSPYRGVALNFGMPIIDRDPATGQGIRQIIGNVFPDYRFSVSQDFQWKKLTLYALLDATIGHDIYNQGSGWSLLDFASDKFDQAGKSVETAKPVGYGWRAGAPDAAGLGGFYDLLGPNSFSVEDGSYAKLREVSLTYKLGSIRGQGDWTFGVVGRNLFTITNYSGFDPEVGVQGGSTGSGIVNQVDAFGFPNLRVFTFTVSTRF